MLTFLKKMRSELKEEKIKLESEMNRIQTELNKNDKFLQSLKKEEEQNYDIFSPRKKNIKMRDNIEILERDQAVLSESLNELQSRFLQVNVRLEEVDNLIKDIRKKNAEKPKKKNIEQQFDSVDFNQNTKSLIQKIELSIQLIRVDPNRCKMELSAVKKILQEMQNRVLDAGNSFNEGNYHGGN